MAGAKFYYSSSESIGVFAAKTASNSSQYTIPKNVFTIHNYYADDDANYKYITPRTSNDYGGWASYDYHAIAKDKFYYASSSSAYTSFKFVHRLSAPLLQKRTRDINWGRCQAPFWYYAIRSDSARGVAKIYWDNSNNIIQINVLNNDGTTASSLKWQGYGVFILLSGGGGGGGGGDSEYWGQGKPGGGGGGGGGTALIYFDAKKAYDSYPGSYLYISLGGGGKGGKGGNGFSAGSAGTESEAKLKTSSGTDMYRITCYGGKGGAGHAWDAAADSAGGAGGTVDTYLYSGQYNNALQFLKLVDSVSGGNGGAGKRGSNGQTGASIASGSWKIPFTDSWGKRDTFTYSSTTCSMGVGSSNNYQGGGGGGCGTGYKSSAAPTSSHGCGMGGYGGGSGQAGAAGSEGFCGIFNNYIPGVSTDCSAEEIPTNYNVNTSSNLIGLQRVYLSTSSTATSGSSSLTVAPGTTVYGYAVLGTDLSTSALSNKGWTLISGTANKQGAVYRVGSKTITAATTFTIELFGSHLDTATVLFTRSGESEGSWSIYNHMLQFMEDQCRIYTSGNSIYASGDDYSGSSMTTKLATFNCPAGYTVTYTLKNSAGSSVAWNTWSSFDGPYTIDAETTAPSTTYSLAGGNDVTVSLPSGAQMLVRNSGTSNDPDLYFSANFDLVVVADDCHWGTYELYGRPALATIYIYNHNGYEHGWAGSGTPEAEAQFIMNNYTPIGVIRYIDGNNSITVSAT